MVQVQDQFYGLGTTETLKGCGQRSTGALKVTVSGITGYDWDSAGRLHNLNPNLFA
jgi:hypothetical protein